MRRVHVVVEGPTEESFIKNVLAQSLWPNQVYLSPIILGAPGHKGGNTNYARVKRDLVLLLRQDQTSYCSTMLDFYGLGDGFPGYPLPANLTSIEKVTRVEQAIRADLIAQIEDRRADVRFLPYLQLHEYEGLLFSDTDAFAAGIGQQYLASQFERVRQAFETPEDINDDVRTAPSRRVRAVFPPYRKVVDGTLGARAVGIERMRQECPHFRNWIETLETLPEIG